MEAKRIIAPSAVLRAKESRERRFRETRTENLGSVGKLQPKEQQNLLGHLRATHQSLKHYHEKCLSESTLYKLCTGLHTLDDGQHSKFIIGPIRFYNGAATANSELDRSEASTSHVL